MKEKKRQKEQAFLARGIATTCDGTQLSDPAWSESPSSTPNDSPKTLPPNL
uniref:Uncharacterized protein n=1 Tax=Ascaris lumbricoides TaxID=6252 RepID=A0A0M3ILI3_ASCLU